MTDRAMLPPRAIAVVPLLVLPIVLCAVALALMPEAMPARVLIIGGAVALAWYLTGGLIAATRFADELRLRRELRALRPELMALSTPAWAVDTQGRVLDQNEAALSIADLQHGSITRLVGRYRANPDHEVDQTLYRMGTRSRAFIDIENGRIAITREPGERVQLWRLQRSDDFVHEISPAQAAADFNLLPVALLRLTRAGEIVESNRAARALLGPLPSGQMIDAILEGPGRPLVDWLAEMAAAPSDMAESAPEVLRALSEGAESYIQVRLVRESQDTLIAVLSDASALKTLEAQFVQSQKMQAIGQLAGGIAHDFNNLLTAITGHCDLLMLRHDKTDPDYADLSQISENANRAGALVGQLLAYSRKQTMNPEVFDLRDTLSDLTHLLNRLVGERINLNFVHDPLLRPIRADKRQLEQVIMNLVVNARDAMAAGGEIVISTQNVKLSKTTDQGRAALPPGDYVRVTVSDQGCGIAPELVEKIFEPFFTTKRQGEGTGLGLSTAYGIVKQSGGYIFCDSTPGEGSVFSLYFRAHSGPAVPAATQPARDRSAAPQAVKDGAASVLLVEDESAVRAFAARALRLRGFVVHEVDSGEAALALLADDRISVDLYITDVVMPGLDGPGWVRSALRTRGPARVIFMSGYTDMSFAGSQPAVPGAVFLPKPFSLSDLIATAEDQLAGRPPSAPAVDANATVMT